MAVVNALGGDDAEAPSKIDVNEGAPVRGKRGKPDGAVLGRDGEQLDPRVESVGLSKLNVEGMLLTNTSRI